MPEMESNSPSSKAVIIFYFNSLPLSLTTSANNEASHAQIFSFLQQIHPGTDCDRDVV